MSDKVRSASEFGRRVTELREARGLSRKDLALAIGMKSESGISEIENGRNFKQYDRLGQIAYVLGTTPDALLGFADAPKTDEEVADFTLACIEAMLIDVERWPEQQAEALTQIASEAASEKQILDLDRRLSAQATAIARYRALRSRT